MILFIILFFYKNKNSYEPIVYENFISEEDASYILEIANNQFQESKLVGEVLNKTIRDSKTCWLSKYDSVVEKIIKKASGFTHLPFENAEDLQVVKYDQDGFYKEHHDACCENNEYCKEFLKRGGQRLATIVIYLNDDFEGGGTQFPNIGKTFKPKKYSGLLFFNNCNKESIHQGTPVIKGSKYICNIWFRESEFLSS